jgi:hypothetical protein
VVINEEARCNIAEFYCLLVVSTPDSEFLKQLLALKLAQGVNVVGSQWLKSEHFVAWKELGNIFLDVKNGLRDFAIHRS